MFLCKHELWKCTQRSRKLWGGLILETNCILEYKPSPHFRLDVVYKMGGRINGTLRYIQGRIQDFVEGGPEFCARVSARVKFGFLINYS